MSKPLYVYKVIAILCDDWHGVERRYDANVLGETAEQATASAVCAFRKKHSDIELEGSERDSVEITHEVVRMERVLEVNISFDGGWLHQAWS